MKSVPNFKPRVNICRVAFEVLSDEQTQRTAKRTVDSNLRCFTRFDQRLEMDRAASPGS